MKWSWIDNNLGVCVILAVLLAVLEGGARIKSYLESRRV